MEEIRTGGRSYIQGTRQCPMESSWKSPTLWPTTMWWAPPCCDPPAGGNEAPEASPGPSGCRTENPRRMPMCGLFRWTGIRCAIGGGRLHRRRGRIPHRGTPARGLRPLDATESTGRAPIAGCWRAGRRRTSTTRVSVQPVGVRAGRTTGDLEIAIRQGRTVRPPPDVMGTTPEAETLLPITREWGSPCSGSRIRVRTAVSGGRPALVLRLRLAFPPRTVDRHSDDGGMVTGGGKRGFRLGGPLPKLAVEPGRRTGGFLRSLGRRCLQTGDPLRDSRHQHLGLADREHRIGGPPGHGHRVARNHRGASALPLGGRRLRRRTDGRLQPRRLRKSPGNGSPPDDAPRTTASSPADQAGVGGGGDQNAISPKSGRRCVRSRPNSRSGCSRSSSVRSV